MEAHDKQCDPYPPQGGEPFTHIALDVGSSVSYIVGATLWACASVMYILGVTEDPVYESAASTYIVGSVFFVSGAAHSLTVLTLRLRVVNNQLQNVRRDNVEKSASRVDAL